MEIEHSNKTSVTKLILLSIVTFGIYHLYWFYKNWRFIKQHDKKDISPGWRTLGSIIPIINIWLIYDQFKSVIELAKKKNIEVNWSAGLLTFLYIFIGVIFLFGPQEFFIEILLIPIITLPLIPIQNYLNKFLEMTERKSVKTKFTTGEIILTIVLIILWILIILGMVGTNYSTSLTDNTLQEIKDKIVWVKYEVTGKNTDGTYFETESSGSGVIFYKNNSLMQIFTNRHVVDCSFNEINCYQRLTESVKIRTQDGKIYAISKLLFAPHGLDIVILELNVVNNNYIGSIVRIDNVQIGEKVTAIGYPTAGLQGEYVQFSTASGKIIDKRQILTSDGFSFDVFDSDAYTNFGSSGGGLFDENGNLIGITTWGDPSKSYSAAIDIKAIDKFDTYNYCDSNSYYSNRGCTETCKKDEVLGNDNKCYSICKDIYCGSEEYKIKKIKECPSGYVSLDGVFCQIPPCGSPTTYCESAQYCFKNQCLSCPYGTYLFEDETCRYLN